MSVKREILMFLGCACCSMLPAQHIPNPVLPGVADAGVIKYNGRYYIGGVRTDGDFYVSDDLVHWGHPVHVVSMDNDWSRGSGAGNDQIHANEMFYLNGEFHLYWSVNYWGKDKHAVHIVHAQSDCVLGPYTEPDRKTWMDNRIDPRVFRDDDGQLYMYMVRFTDGNTIWGRKMKNPAGFSGDPVCLFASLPDTWETMDNRVAEGPWVMKYRDTYYLMYNANHTGTEWGNYQLGVAQADSPLGFQQGNKYSYPVLSSNQVVLEEQYVDILRYGSGCYDPKFYYTETRPSGNWTDVTYEPAGWNEGEAGFSSKEIQGSSTRKKGTYWDTPVLWLHKKFMADRSCGNLALRVAHDGDTKVYLNGTLIYEKEGADYVMVNLDARQRKALKVGKNVLTAETAGEHSHFFDVALFDMKETVADDILMTPGQPNIVRGVNGFEWWLVYMANRNRDSRSQYIDRVQFFDKTMYVGGITGPKTSGYRPLPALPTFSLKEEVPASGPLQVRPSAAYLFETSVKTNGEAGAIAWWQDAANYAYVGTDEACRHWYLRTCLDGKEHLETFGLPEDFRPGVYHHWRIERNEEKLKVWLDEIPAPGKAVFTAALPATKGVPGVYDLTGNALFEGSAYTIGFDEDELKVSGLYILKGELLEDYEVSFSLDDVAGRTVGSYPVYVDENNYVKAVFNDESHTMEVTAVKKGKQMWKKDFSLECLQTVYPDVKYTDFVEKNYRFSAPVCLDALYLNRHEEGNRQIFTENMFDHFDIEYLCQGEWHPIRNEGVTVAAHPAYNRLAFTPVWAEGVRFINRNAEDLQRHIYKIGIHEQWKNRYHFRAVRRGTKLYLFVDGREIGTVDIPYPPSRIGFYAEHPSVYKGVLYYHIN